VKKARDANRELRAQGLANVFAGLAGGLPNSPSMLRSLALAEASPNARSSVLIYSVSLLGLLLMPQVLGWLPLSAIGGVLALQGVQTIDPWLWRTRGFVRFDNRPGSPVHDPIQRRLLLDNWAVALIVVAISLIFGLAAAVAAGAGLAVMLFVRSNMRQVVRSQRTGAERKSMKVRSPQATTALQQAGRSITLIELQGALFFGTADTVRSSLEQLPPDVRTVVLDLFLVGEIDVTGSRILLEIANDWAGQGRHLVAAEWDEHDVRRRTVDAIAHSADLPCLTFFRDVDEALEAAENRLLINTSISDIAHESVQLEQTLLAKGLDAVELDLLREKLQVERFAAGATIFRQGDAADAFYLTVEGDVGIRLAGSERRLVSFAPGTMIGEMAALARGKRSADAVAETPLTLLRLTTDALEHFQRDQPLLASKLLNNIALHLAGRLRDLTQDLSTWIARTGTPSVSSALSSGDIESIDRGLAEFGFADAATNHARLLTRCLKC
jgi:SulP family sulfate permease